MMAIMHQICPILTFSLQFYAVFNGTSHLSYAFPVLDPGYHFSPNRVDSPLRNNKLYTLIILGTSQNSLKVMSKIK